MLGGGSKWPFSQLGVVVLGFHAAAIGLLLVTGSWGMEPPLAIVRASPLWKAFGQQNVLVPAAWFDSLRNAAAARAGVNMIVWAFFQWVGGGLILDLLRQGASK